MRQRALAQNHTLPPESALRPDAAVCSSQQPRRRAHAHISVHFGRPSDRTVVMNTQAELQQAFGQMERGTFVTDDHSESRIPLPHGKKT